MGTDLRLLPFLYGDGDCSHDIIRVERDTELYEAIQGLSCRDVPITFTSFCGRQSNSEYGYGKTIEDPYGDPVKFVFARQLKKMDFSNPRHGHKSVKAYIDAMDDDAMIALYWH